MDMNINEQRTQLWKYLKIAPRIDKAWQDMLPNSVSISSILFAFENIFPVNTSSASDNL